MLVSLDSLKLVRQCRVNFRSIMPHTDEIVLTEVEFYGIITILQPRSAIYVFTEIPSTHQGESRQYRNLQIEDQDHFCCK